MVAKATFKEVWEDKMLQLKEIKQDAYEWLMKTVDTNAWYKHAFSYYPKCDLLMNNLSEAFNSTILVAWEKSIITLFDWIWSYLMAWFVTENVKLHYVNSSIKAENVKP